MLNVISSSNTKLKYLIIVQNENTPKTVLPCSANAWILFQKQTNGNVRVNLYASVCGLLLQPMAPVYSITCCDVCIEIFDYRNRGKNNNNLLRYSSLCLSLQVNQRRTMEIIQHYNKTLSIYKERNVTSSTNCDKDMIDLIKNCSLTCLVSICSSCSWIHFYIDLNVSHYNR